MKKILLLVLCAIILLIATGCTHYTKDGQEIYMGFALIRDVDESSHICYDTNTNICYVIFWNSNTHGVSGISPYYILENEEPVIAVYGKNYN